MRRVVLLSCMLVACSDRKAAVGVDELDFDHGFIVTLRDDGSVVRLSEPFGVQDQTFTYGPEPSLILESEETEVVLVTLDDDSILGLVGGFDRTRAAEIDALPEQPPLAPTPLTTEDRVRALVRSAVPDGARFMSTEIDDEPVLAEIDDERESALRAQITLELPVDSEYCRVPNQTGLAQFARELNPISPLWTSTIAKQSVPRLEAVEWLDEDHVFVLSTRGAYVIRRGGEVVDHVFARDLFDTRNYERFRRHAIGPADATGRRELLIVGGYEPGPDDAIERASFGRVWSFTIEGRRLLSVESGARRPNALFRAVAIHTNGSAVVAGELGVLLRRPSGAADFVEERVPLFVDFVMRAIALPFDDRPFVVTSRGRIHHLVFRAGRLFWENSDVLQGGVLDPERYTWFGLDATLNAAGDDVTLYASANRAGYARRTSWSAPWERLELTGFPPRFIPCASTPDVTGEILFHRALYDAQLEGGYVHIAPQLCNAILQQRVSDGCLSMLTIEGADPAFDRAGMRALDTRAGELVAGATDGRLWSASWVTEP